MIRRKAHGWTRSVVSETVRGAEERSTVASCDRIPALYGSRKRFSGKGFPEHLPRCRVAPTLL